MKNSITLIVRVFCILMIITNPIYSAYSQEVYNMNFNSLPTGSYNEEMVEDALNVTFCKGADEGRVHITNTPDNNRVLDVRYPKGQVKTSSSGMHTKVPFDDGQSHEELYFSYRVFFPDDFEFRAGAKLPGLAYQTSERNMSLRLMWRKDGLLEFYVHYDANQPRDYQASINWSLTDPYNEPGNQPQPDQVKVRKGEWNDIEMYFKLNTPGQNDGVMRGWLNGELAVDITDNGDFRLAEEDDIKMNIIYLSTFFGGTDETFQPTKDVYAYFDDLEVSKNRIGNGGSTGGDTNVAVTGVNLIPSSLLLETGQTLNLSASVSPSNATNQNITWQSSNATIVSVNSQGGIEAISPGEVTITVQTEDGGFEDTITVTIEPESTGGGTGDGSLQVIYQVGDSNPNDNAIKANLKLENTGSSPASFGDISMRYWFTKEGTGTPTAIVDYASAGKDKVNVNIVEVSGSLCYAQVSFDSSLGMLAPDEDTGAVKVRINYSNWTDHDESNDYSFDPTKSLYSVHERITAYDADVLVFGNEPSSFSMARTASNLSQQMTLSAETLNANTENTRILVYPNPSLSGKFQLSRKDQWRVFSTDGKQLLKGTSNEVDLSDLTKGTYLFKLEKDKQVYRLIKP